MPPAKTDALRSNEACAFVSTSAEHDTQFGRSRSLTEGLPCESIEHSCERGVVIKDLKDLNQISRI